MKLVFIYGPPAVGKTTVGRALTEQTGYRFFYNHLTVPVAKAIFPTSDPWHDERYSDLLKVVRLDTIKAAAQAQINTIFTLAYSGAVDDDFVAQIVQAVAAEDGSTHFVQLHAPRDILFERVGSESRKRMRKLTSVDYLKHILELRDMGASVKYPNILKLDTSRLQPTESATTIAEHFGLTV